MAIEATIWRNQQAQRMGLQLAWLTAALGRAKRMPSLRRILTGPARRLHGPELQRRRTEHRRMASQANVAAIVAAINRQRQRREEGE